MTSMPGFVIVVIFAGFCIWCGLSGSFYDIGNDLIQSLKNMFCGDGVDGTPEDTEDKP